MEEEPVGWRTQWRSYLHHADEERLGIEKIVFKHLDPKPLEK